MVTPHDNNIIVHLHSKTISYDCVTRSYNVAIVQTLRNSPEMCMVSMKIEKSCVLIGSLLKADMPSV